MSKMTSITIKFDINISPKELVRIFINNGWEYNNEGDAVYLEAHDIDDYNWTGTPINEFNIESFLSSHKNDDRVAIWLEKDECGGSFHIYPDKLMVLLSVDIPMLEGWNCQDFSWCLKQLAFMLDYVSVPAVECSVVY